MNIGFDAKRAFHNATGLGNYSRTLIQSLLSYYPTENYFLFNPKKKLEYSFSGNHIHEINPTGFIDTLFPSLWRSTRMIKDIEKHVEIYHGLSNELPFGIHKSSVKKIVTIHDLIYESFPEQYHKNDISIYRKKFKYACKSADRIIAISESTKKDLVDLYSIPNEKIEVCYQSCNERFYTCIAESQKQIIKEKYNLHTPYFLSVGSIIERKNLLRTCEAFFELVKTEDMKLVVIGKGNGVYKQKVLSFIKQHHLEDKILFLEDFYSPSEIERDMIAIYQNAQALLYTSHKEGFGIPVLEAMASQIPVITSNISSMPEVGGNAAQYVNPNDVNELYLAMKNILSDTMLRKQCITLGIQQAQLFGNKNTCDKAMNIYKQLN